MTTLRTITVTVEPLPDSPEFLAYSDDVQCLATGDTAEEAVLNFREALHDLLSYYGEELTVEYAQTSIRFVLLA